MRRACVLALTLLLASCSAARKGGGSGDGGSRRDTRRRDAAAALVPRPTDDAPGGLYAREVELGFNVLDGASFDEARGTITLFGHRDPAYRGHAIPWLQHLAEFLDHPDPEFSLEWTSASGRDVDDYLGREESADDSRRFAEIAGRIVDEYGRVSEAGRLLLAGMGVQPTWNGAAPGYSGIRIGEVSRFSNNAAKVSFSLRVVPGSPASRAGLKDGDIAGWLNGYDLLDPEAFLHELRFSGAGTRHSLRVLRPGTGGVDVDFVTEPAHGDPWTGLTSNELAAALLRAGGFREAADVTYWTGVVRRLNAANIEAEQTFERTFRALGLGPTWDKWDKDIAAGRMDISDAVERFMELFCQALERAFRAYGSPCVSAWRRASAGGDFESGFAAAVDAIEPHRKQALRTALETLAKRREGTLVSPELVEAAFGIRLEVEPRFLNGLDPSSQLARVMFAADYAAKSLLHAPHLKRRIPGYRTVYEHDRARRVRSGEWRLWLEPGGIEGATSPDGRTLEIRRGRVRIQVRPIDAGGRNLPAEPGNYGELLTSLYDDLARESAALHEFRECAKLAEVARWLAGRRPGLRLPREGRVAWRGPESMPGFVYEYMGAPDGGGRHTVSVYATGGASFKLGLTAFPQDAGVVDLRGCGAVPETEAWDNVELRRVLRVKTTPPPPVATVARGRRGDRVLTAASVALESRDRLDPETTRKLEEAAALARQLSMTERAIAAITDQAGDRDALYDRIRADLETERGRFVDGSTGLLRALLGEVRLAPGVARDARELAGTLEERAETAEALWKLATADTSEKREEAARELAGVAAALGQEALSGRFGDLVRSGSRFAASVRQVEGAARVSYSLTRLARLDSEMSGLDRKTEAELKALKEKLLPLQRDLEDRLRDMRDDPSLARYLER
jgi:hypothetical protein